MQSTRFQNAPDMVCPVRSGHDLTGRPVHPDTYVDVTSGCSHPHQRMLVENCLRPRYTEFVALDAAGIHQDAPRCHGGSSASREATQARSAMLDHGYATNGTYGNDLGAHIRNSDHNSRQARERDQRMDQLEQARPNPQNLVHAGAGAYARLGGYHRS